jgi:hypothetical protein
MTAVRSPDGRSMLAGLLAIKAARGSAQDRADLERLGADDHR